MLISKVRRLFDAVIAKYNTMVKYIHPKSEIVNNPLFENALVKLQAGVKLNLATQENEAVKLLKVSRCVCLL